MQHKYFFIWFLKIMEMKKYAICGFFIFKILLDIDTRRKIYPIRGVVRMGVKMPFSAALDARRFQNKQERVS